MLALNQTHEYRSDPEIWLAAYVSADVAGGSPPGAGPHDLSAWATALDDGLMDEEICQVLAGRRMVEAFPVHFRESPQAYATRAVAEMMVAYLS